VTCRRPMVYDDMGGPEDESPPPRVGAGLWALALALGYLAWLTVGQPQASHEAQPSPRETMSEYLGAGRSASN
jgi:hypothetical protein